MPVLNTRQVVGQGLTTGAGTGRLGGGSGGGGVGSGLLLQSGFGGRDVAGEGFLEQIAGRGGQGFTFDTETHPPQMSQFEDERLNLRLRGMEFGITTTQLLNQSRRVGAGRRRVPLDLIEQCLNGTENPLRDVGSGVEAGEFSVRIHA